jgi:hypothetical protein
VIDCSTTVPHTHCLSLIRPPGIIAGRSRHPRFVGHFSQNSDPICMGNQTNRLTATKTLNHLVRLFYNRASKDAPSRDVLLGTRLAFQ